MGRRDTPQELRDFFDAIDTGDTSGAEACKMHYGCACIVHRARRAAELLVTIQKALGVESAPAAAQPAAAPVDDGRAAELEKQVQAEQQKSRELAEQVEKLGGDNDRLRSHIQLLQKQINRIYDRREMSSVLGRLEGGKETPPSSEATGTEGDQPSEADEPERETVAAAEAEGTAEGEAEPAPAPKDEPESEKKEAPKADSQPKPKKQSPLADMLDAEGAMPVREPKGDGTAK